MTAFAQQGRQLGVELRPSAIRLLAAINGRSKCAEELPQKRTLNRGAPPYHRRRYFPQ